jgi:hypothetical protein
MYTCDKCDKSFTREGWFKKHVCDDAIKVSKKTSVETETFVCEYCDKSFTREGWLERHMCDKKKRFFQKNDKSVVAGFAAFNYWYKIAMNAKKDKTFEQFNSSRYYKSFVKFGEYIVKSKIADWESYVRWLSQNNTKLEDWAKDSIVNQFYIMLNKIESPDRAVEKFILVAEDWGDKTGYHWSDFWEKANPHLILDYIKEGKISPWILFSSIAAQEFVDNLPDEMVHIIIENVDVDFWKKKTKVNKEDVKWISQLLP